MSNHPIIKALQDKLDAERPWLASAAKAKWNDRIQQTLVQTGYKQGHEAATERLMSLLEKAVEMATEVEMSERILHKDTGLSICSRIAREFLLSVSETVADATTLADAGEISKESGDDNR